jgi:hypothetical protein
MSCETRRLGAGCFALGAALTVGAAPAAHAARPGCPSGMASVLGRFCVDRWEASLDVVDRRGRTRRRHSPYHAVASDQLVVARSRPGVVPQAYVSRDDAARACETAGKRLCTDAEWIAACQGRTPTVYPYGDEFQPRRCNDAGISPLLRLFGEKPTLELYGYEAMNDPRLNQVPGSLARTGQFRRCRNSFGVHDMVGNLHEWTADPSGTFRGGYYLDTKANGEGCRYKTVAHAPSYHDYSTGFRCCSRPGGERRRAARAAPR